MLLEGDKLADGWQCLEIGRGRVEVRKYVYFMIGAASDEIYHNAQIDDYAGKKRADFAWHAPLSLRVRAWASHPVEELRGTAGFGFWNHPFMPTVKAIPRLPRAIWFFFAAPPSNITLAKGVAGHGWKAATIDAITPAFFALLPCAPLGFLLMRIPLLYRMLWGIGQRAIKVSEKLLAVDITEPHEYELRWEKKSAAFYVDGELIHQTPFSPRGALGFIAWMDNQYAVVTPQGKFAFGYVATPHEQYLALESIEITQI